MSYGQEVSVIVGDLVMDTVGFELVGVRSHDTNAHVFKILGQVEENIKVYLDERDFGRPFKLSVLFYGDTVSGEKFVEVFAVHEQTGFKAHADKVFTDGDVSTYRIPLTDEFDLFVRLLAE